MGNLRAVYLASERSERDTYRDNTIENRGCFCLYIYLDVRKAFLYFDPRVFVLVMWSTPSRTSLNRILCLSISTRITLEIELFTVLNSFAGAVKA